MLDDAFGPASTHPTADALVVSPETRTGGEAINRKRLDAGLAPLTLIEVAHRKNAAGTILSSTAIRNGSMDPTGASWINDAWRTHVMAMSPAAEAHLKTPSGTPYKGPEENPEVAMAAVLDDLSSLDGPLIAVGDVTARVMLELDTVPDLALIDGQTKRVALDEDEAVDDAGDGLDVGRRRHGACARNGAFHCGTCASFCGPAEAECRMGSLTTRSLPRREDVIRPTAAGVPSLA